MKLLFLTIFFFSFQSFANSLLDQKIRDLQKTLFSLKKSLKETKGNHPEIKRQIDLCKLGLRYLRDEKLNDDEKLKFNGE